MTRLCDQCHAATAQFILPQYDLAFCGHHWNKLPDDVKASGLPIFTALPQPAIVNDEVTNA